MDLLEAFCALFFCQAEDGIRDWTVTGVQTCALPIYQAVASVVTVVVSFAYAFVTGVGPPVWRAALMLAIYLGARFLYRERSMLNALGAAALGVLIFDPHAIFGASFQLTFLSVLIIAAIGVPVLERSTLPYAQGLRLLRFTSYDLHVPALVAQFPLVFLLLTG